jgi:hypothetical protein
VNQRRTHELAQKEAFAINDKQEEVPEDQMKWYVRRVKGVLDSILSI